LTWAMLTDAEGNIGDSIQSKLQIASAIFGSLSVNGPLGVKPTDGRGCGRLGPRLYWPSMIRITITLAAFEAIAATMPLGSVPYEREPDAKGERWIWPERFWRVSSSG
jgi:hypothetical protein